MSLTRSVPWLLLLPALGAAGWFGGRWAHEGLLPAPHTVSTRTAPAVPHIQAPREPQVAPSSSQGKWMTRAKSAAPADFPALMDEFQTAFPTSGDFETRQAALQWILGLWIARDADAAAAWVAARVAEKKDEMMGSDFGLVLGSVAPAKKIEEILNGPHGKALGQYFKKAVMRSLSVADPREHLRLFANADSKSLPPHWDRALAAIAATNPQEAATLWQSNQKKGHEKALFAVLGAWVLRDPQAARQWADSLEDPKARHFAQHAWLGALARQDPAAAREALKSMDAGAWIAGKPGGTYSSEFYPTDARMEIAIATARQDLSAALADLAAIPAPPADSKPAKFKPGDDIDTLRPQDARKDTLHAIVKAAAPSLPDEPQALLTALQTLKARAGAAMDDTLYADIEAAFWQEKFRDGPSGIALEAARLLAAQPDNGRRAGIVNNLLYKAASDNPAAIVTFLNTLPEAQRGELAAKTFPALGQDDPALLAKAAALIPADRWTSQMGTQLARAGVEFASVLSPLPVNMGTSMARQEFATTWARDDPRAAAQWALNLPPEGGAAAAARGVTGAWAKYDDAAASAWTASLTPGPARDGAALGLVTALAATEPDAAWKWAGSVSDTSLAAIGYTSVARAWGRDAPPEFRTALTTAIDAAGITGENRTQALDSLDKPRGGSQLSPKR